MSKKQAKFEREIDLPDWADEVTPADEVMKKFYAPTGAFKRGPLASPDLLPTVVSAPVFNQVTDDQSPQNEWRQQIEIKSQADVPPLPRPVESQEAPAAQPISVTPHSQQSHTVETPKAPADSLELKHKPTPSPNLTNIDPFIQNLNDESASHISDVSALASFEEFAGKWKTYLYSSQVAVMKALYEITCALDSNECFTSYSEIAKATQMSRRNCIRVINTLVKWGFVERLEIRNDAASRGIRLRIHPDPQFYPQHISHLNQ